jgi:hypothetical protein
MSWNDLTGERGKVGNEKLAGRKKCLNGTGNVPWIRWLKPIRRQARFEGRKTRGFRRA